MNLRSAANGSAICATNVEGFYEHRRIVAICKCEVLPIQARRASEWFICACLLPEGLAFCDKHTLSRSRTTRLRVGLVFWLARVGQGCDAHASCYSVGTESNM